MDTLLTIDEVARRTGLTAHTLRYYERIGLIAPVPRASGGQRRYATADLDWIEFLLRLRDTRMPVAQMLVFARLRAEGDATVPPFGLAWRETAREEHASEAGRPAYSFVTLERVV